MHKIGYMSKIRLGLCSVCLPYIFVCNCTRRNYIFTVYQLMHTKIEYTLYYSEFGAALKLFQRLIGRTNSYREIKKYIKIWFQNLCVKHRDFGIK